MRKKLFPKFTPQNIYFLLLLFNEMIISNMNDYHVIHYIPLCIELLGNVANLSYVFTQFLFFNIDRTRDYDVNTIYYYSFFLYFILKTNYFSRWKMFLFNFGYICDSFTKTFKLLLLLILLPRKHCARVGTYWVWISLAGLLNIKDF